MQQKVEGTHGSLHVSLLCFCLSLVGRVFWLPPMPGLKPAATDTGSFGSSVARILGCPHFSPRPLVPQSPRLLIPVSHHRDNCFVDHGKALELCLLALDLCLERGHPAGNAGGIVEPFETAHRMRTLQVLELLPPLGLLVLVEPFAPLQRQELLNRIVKIYQRREVESAVC